jgi:hypothetical protein
MIVRSLFMSVRSTVALAVLNLKHVVMIAADQIKNPSRSLASTWRKLLLMASLGLGLGLFLALVIPLKVS